jgi:hypothetical protein
MPSFLVLSFALTFGWIPSASDAVEVNYDNRLYEYNNSLYQDIELNGELFKTVDIYTSIRIADYYVSGATFAPFRADFTIGARVKHDFGNMELWAGIEHQCRHKVISPSVSDAGSSTGSYTEITAGIRGTIGGSK